MLGLIHDGGIEVEGSRYPCCIFRIKRGGIGRDVVFIQKEKGVDCAQCAQSTPFGAEREGFKPPERTSRSPDFESGPIGHSGISPGC